MNQPQHRTTSPLDINALRMSEVTPCRNIAAARRNGELFVTILDGNGNALTFVTGLEGQDVLRRALGLTTETAEPEVTSQDILSWAARQHALNEASEPAPRSWADSQPLVVLT